MNLFADVLSVERRTIALGGAEPREDASAASFRTLSDIESPITFQALIARGGAQARVDPALIEAVIAKESAFHADAVSAAGAQGLMQLMPETAAATGVSDPYDPAQNIRGGARYLRSLLDRFGGDVRSALAAYNAGPGAVERYGGIPPYAETRAYVGEVFSAYEALRRRVR